MDQQSFFKLRIARSQQKCKTFYFRGLDPKRHGLSGVTSLSTWGTCPVCVCVCKSLTSVTRTSCSVGTFFDARTRTQAPPAERASVADFCWGRDVPGSQFSSESLVRHQKISAGKSQRLSGLEQLSSPRSVCFSFVDASHKCLLSRERIVKNHTMTQSKERFLQVTNRRCQWKSGGNLSVGVTVEQRKHHNSVDKASQ